MDMSLGASAKQAPRERAEIPAPRMAKANLRKAENGDYRPDIGRAIQRAGELAGLVRLQQFAAAIGRDPRQVARWMDGSERPQLDAIWAVELLRGPMVIALAEMCHGVEVNTTVVLRRIG